MALHARLGCSTHHTPYRTISLVKMNSMQLVRCATDLKTLLADLTEGRIITAFDNNPNISHLQYGMLDLQKFARNENKKDVRYCLDCSWTHNKKTNVQTSDLLHSFFFLPKELKKKKHRMARCKIRKSFEQTKTKYAILDTVVQDVLHGRRSLPDRLLLQPILLLRTQWMKKVARRNKVKLPVQYIVPSTAVEL